MLFRYIYVENMSNLKKCLGTFILNLLPLRKTVYKMKQKHTLHTFILILLSTLLLSACTSFSEGPKVSLRTVRKKMDNTWKVKEAVKFGKENTELYKDGYFLFQEDGSFSSLNTKRFVKLPPFTQDTALTIVATGDWRLLAKDKFEILYNYTFKDPYNPLIPPYNAEAYEQWEILRLTPTEFWVKNDSMSFKFIPN